MVTNKVCERPAADKVHDNEEEWIHAVSDKADNVFVVDPGEHHDLLGKSLESLFVDETGSHALDRDEFASLGPVMSEVRYCGLQ